MKPTIDWPLADAILNGLQARLARPVGPDPIVAIERKLRDGVETVPSPAADMGVPRHMLELTALNLALAASQGDLDRVDSEALKYRLNPRLRAADVREGVGAAVLRKGDSLPEGVSDDAIWWWGQTDGDTEYAVADGRVVGMITFDERFGWGARRMEDIRSETAHGDDKAGARAAVEGFFAVLHSPPPGP